MPTTGNSAGDGADRNQRPAFNDRPRAAIGPLASRPIPPSMVTSADTAVAQTRQRINRRKADEDSKTSRWEKSILEGEKASRLRA